MLVISKLIRAETAASQPLAVEPQPSPRKPVFEASGVDECTPVRRTGTFFRILDEGFGFIHCDGGGKDHFVRIGAMSDRDDWEAARTAIETKGGARVSFCSAPPKVKNQSPRALDVILIVTKPAAGEKSE